MKAKSDIYTVITKLSELGCPLDESIGGLELDFNLPSELIELESGSGIVVTLQYEEVEWIVGGADGLFPSEFKWVVIDRSRYPTIPVYNLFFPHLRLLRLEDLTGSSLIDFFEKAVFFYDRVSVCYDEYCYDIQLKQIRLIRKSNLHGGSLNMINLVNAALLHSFPGMDYALDNFVYDSKCVRPRCSESEQGVVVIHMPIELNELIVCLKTPWRYLT